MNAPHPGDIILSRGNSALGRAIRWGMTSRGEAPSLVNHASLVVAGAVPLYDTLIVESDLKVRLGSLGKLHADDHCFVFRPLNIGEAQRDLIVSTAWSRLGQRFPWWQLPLQLIDAKVFGGKVLARRLSRPSSRAVCSRLVAEAYARVGLDFALPAYAVDPDSMLDFCLANPDKYALTWAGVPGRPPAVA